MPSWQASVVKRVFAAALAAQRAALTQGISPEATEEELEAGALRLRSQMESMARYTPLPRWAAWEEAAGAPVDGEWVVSERAEHDRVILHLHGGAFLMGSPRTHRGLAATLSRVGRGRVFVPDYRLAPEHAFPAALEDAVASYQWVLETAGVRPDRVAVVGDSAGGGLAVSLLVELRDAGAELPACYVGLSPWTDLAATGASIEERAALDVWLRAELMPLAARGYHGDVPADDPRVSPLYADLHGLPPMLVHSGTDEILFDDARRLVERAREAGVAADHGVFEGMWHVFQAFPGVPETRRSLREIGAFIRRHTDARRTVATQRLSA